MQKTQPFYDFCVPLNKNAQEMRATLQELIELGYKTIAIEEVFDHSKKDTHTRGADIFPEPANIAHWQTDYAQQLKILQRLTIIYQDKAVAHAMSKSLNLQKFNLIAGQPKTDAALTHCCTDFIGDIITFDMQSGGKLMVNRKAYKVAIQRGMYFELKYALAIRDSNNRKHMIKLAHNYFVKGKSKNIIMSSGAHNAFELRGPYDVANLAYIFDLTESQGKNAIDKFGRLLYLQAESRRIGKTIMYAKSTGPIVLSDTSSSSESEVEDEQEAEELEKDAEENETSNANDEESENVAVETEVMEEEGEDNASDDKENDAELAERPKKKQRIR